MHKLNHSHLKDHFQIKWYQRRLTIGFFLVCMITWEKLSRGEGELVEGDPEIGSRKRTSQSENMASE